MIDQRQEIEIKTHTYKFYLLISFTSLLFVLLLSRLGFLQIYQGEQLKKLSDSNRFKKQVLIAPRGRILDRKERILVGNKKVSQLIISMSSQFPLDDRLKKISDIIKAPVQTLKDRVEISRKKYSPFHPVVLMENLPVMSAHKIKQLRWNYPEIQVQAVEKRVYSLKANGSQIFGFIGAISKRDIQKLKEQNRRFYLSDVVGKSGLEKLYNQELKGKNGFSMVEVDAQNRPSTQSLAHPFSSFRIDPARGEDLSLTLDKNLQDFTLKAMRRKDSLYPRTGSVVVMKTNGEILALLSEPGFDPNILSSSIDEELWSKWSAKDSKIFINKAFQENYSPGSVFKPFVGLAGLQEGLITEETLIDSQAVFKLGNRVFHDHNRSGYGKIDLMTAIERSANTFFYQLANKLGVDKIYYYASLFGFGAKTQIKLPGEIAGLLPSPEWRKKYFNKAWRKGDTINLSIGQGELLTTLLQLTVAYNAIATEGLIVKPFLLKKKGERTINQPFILDSLTDRIDRKHFITLKKALKQVVQGEKGTARWYKLPFVSFSGKTGTAQVISLDSKSLYKECRQLAKEYRHHGWFISFAPSDDPEIVVSVFTEHSCSGSKGSASVARDIIQYYFKNKD
ncbi:MAG: penicillin-binding protein 2 [Oligoflexia bacterium]|nr:penicillin-binding protein 2 [Oligoflexia bacterium]